MDKTPKYKTTRIWEKTLATLRMIHALTGKSIVAILDRLATEELQRIQQEMRSNEEVSFVKSGRIEADE